MERTNVSNLKNRLSAYLKRVRAGETVIVLDRNRPTARIEPMTGAESDDERIARLVAKGILTPAKKPLPAGFFKRKLPKSRRSVVAAVIEERDEGW